MYFCMKVRILKSRSTGWVLYEHHPDEISSLRRQTVAPSLNLPLPTPGLFVAASIVLLILF